MTRRLVLTEEMALSTIRITTQLADGAIGSGTGFFFQFCHDGSEFLPGIVTNKHVLDGASMAGIHFSVRDELGEKIPGAINPVEIGNLRKARVDHPDKDVDLTVILFGGLQAELESKGVRPLYKAFGFSDLATQAELDDLGAMEPIVMIGYPIGLWDHINNQPIFRRGVTATHPCVDFQGRKEFMIDCSCWPGSSGSPVVLYKESGVMTRNMSLSVGEPRMRLLGILHAGPQFNAKGEIFMEEGPTIAVPVAETSVMINLGYVIKAEQLRVLDRYIADRREEIQKNTKP